MLRIIAGVSGLYDFVGGALLLLAGDWLATVFSVPPANPPIFSNLNALFLMSIGAGYYLPWNDPQRYRGYLWVMGPLLKGAGAALFIVDYLYRGSPQSFLIFAASDGILAVATLYALVRSR